MQAIQDLKDPSTTPKRLKEIYQEGRCAQALWPLLASHPSTPLEILLAVGAHHPRELLQNPVFPLLLLENPSVVFSWPVNTVSGLVSCEASPEYFLAQAAKHPQPLVRSAAARNPAATPALLALLASDAHGMVLCSVAANPNTPPEQLTDLAMHKGGAVRGCIAKNPSTPAFVLLGLSKDPDSTTRAAIASNPNTPAKTFSWLIADGALAVRQIAWQRPEAPPELLTLLQRLQQDSSAKITASEQATLASLGGFGHELLAKHPETESVYFAKIVKETPWLGRIIVTHPKMSASALALLSGNYDTQVRAQVAAHPSCPSEALSSLLADREPTVRRAATAHPNAPQELLRFFWRAGADKELQGFTTPQPLSIEELDQLFIRGYYARRLLSRHPDTSSRMLALIVEKKEHIEPIAAHPKADEALLQEISKYAPKQVALNPNATAALLGSLVSGYRGVRFVVARHPNTPPEVLSALLSDKCREVRYEASKHKSLPAERCEALSTSSDWLLRRAAARHPSTPSSCVERLCSDPDSRVSRSALARRARSLAQHLDL